MHSATTPHHRIRELREARGLTQAQLAKAIGVSQSAIVRIDQNPAARISLDLGIRIAEVFGIEPASLLNPRSVARERI